MYKTTSQARSFIDNFLKIFKPQKGIEVAMAPPFIALPAVHQALKGNPKGLSIRLAAQNLYSQDEGAFTGEVSAPMIKELGCEYVIIGHSERRQHFMETNEFINQKVHAALRHDLEPILCVGERLTERENGQTESVIDTQVVQGLEGVKSEQMSSITIAYEPVWAIGTGQAATVGQAAEVHAHIRKTITEKWGVSEDQLRILYGGSVSPDNAGPLFQDPQINGALVGKACLNPESFASIISLAPLPSNK